MLTTKDATEDKLDIFDSIVKNNNCAEILTNTKLYKYHRYSLESELLRLLSITQLNISKNASKPPFESLHINEIVNKVKEELNEFLSEIYNPAPEINFKRAFEELGDVAACLVGCCAYLLHLKEKS